MDLVNPLAERNQGFLIIGKRGSKQSKATRKMSSKPTSGLGGIVVFPYQPLHFPLIHLLYQGKKQTGRYTLKGVVLYREPIPLWQYFVFVPLLLVWSALAFRVFSPVDNALINTLFAWIPHDLVIANSFENIAQYSQSALMLTLVAGFAFNGILGPVVVELYFRGYLLPRIPASRKWAPLINVLLFSLYHFFSPWQNLTRIVALIPLVYAVEWKRNIYLSLITHCLLNTLGMLGTLALLMR